MRFKFFFSGSEYIRKAIAEIIGWQGKVVIVPKSQMLDSWNFEANLDQHWITDSTRIRTELGYREICDRQLSRLKILEKIKKCSNYFCLIKN
ncbi:MAG: hypothetical protein QNJ72_02285 [Pleurocapsa sp. MO_226.B13]|nr:hypothetical protein [Pleurocapsa sp. MO_226.B13]